MDLFENYETLPQNVLDVLSKHGDGDFTYEVCESLKNDLELVGYTCDYGLDATPFNLRKDFREGGAVLVAECYLNDEVSVPHRSEMSEKATINSEPSDCEELVAIQYESGLIDFVPQDILEIL
jgi:hypothetical protein